MKYLMIVIYIAFTVSGLILMKKGGNAGKIGIGSGEFSFSISWISALGFICYIISFLLFTRIIMMFDNASIDSFVKLSTELPSLKDYIALRGAGMYYLLDNKTAAVQELKNVGGKYAELGAGMLYDMGESIVPSNYLNGSMREVWHYRNVLSSDNNSVETNINNFKLLYPESPLLKMVENWNVK